MTGLKIQEPQSDLPSANPTRSYWHREPRLQGHRSTAELPATADVVVIGAGITGAFASRELCEKGRGVVLVEAREVAWGATGRVSIPFLPFPISSRIRFPLTATSPKCRLPLFPFATHTYSPRYREGFMLKLARMAATANQASSPTCHTSPPSSSATTTSSRGS